MLYADTIKSLRETLHMSYTQFGALVGVSDMAVRYWEKGHRQPSVNVVHRMLQIARKRKLNVKLKDFLDTSMQIKYLDEV